MENAELRSKGNKIKYLKESNKLQSIKDMITYLSLMRQHYEIINEIKLFGHQKISKKDMILQICDTIRYLDQDGTEIYNKINSRSQIKSIYSEMNIDRKYKIDVIDVSRN